MGLYHSPRIVTDGLVLCLDAANAKSYPGSGTSWSDLSANGNTGTLVNGPTYNSSNGGSIVFDGVNDRTTIPSNSAWGLPTSSTLNIWYNVSSSSGQLIGYQKGGWTGYLIGPGSISYSGQSGSNDFDRNFSYSLNTWYMLTWVIDRTANLYSIYLNSVKQGSSGTITHPSLSASTLHLGARGDVPDNFMTGKISNFAFYNKALTAEEIQQNFNALRGRFGI